MAMDDRNLQRVKVLLQETEVQVRVRENIRKGGEEAKVTIGRAAELFDIKASKLRELDHLLKPERSTGTETGQRQYSLTELKKLAIISELLREGCATAEIPSNIDNVWQEVAGSETHQEQEVEKREDTSLYLPINRRIEEARKNLFWRYFASHALRLSLSSICEDIPNSPAGLILPLNLGTNIVAVNSIKDLPKVGESLVGWLSQSRSSHTLLTSRPSFEYESDYSLLRLTEMKDDKPLQPPTDNTLIILNRQDRRSVYLTLNAPTVETIRRLLAPIYENAQTIRECFGPGMCDALDPSTLIDSRTQDLILTGLAEMIVHLGGYMPDKSERWRFCCILLPNSPASVIPLQQRSLVVRAQSKNSPHKVGGTTVPPQGATVGLSIRAFQSGRIVYRSDIPPDGYERSMIAFGKEEDPIRSAIATPVGGEDGQPVAVVYVVSAEKEAFPEREQRTLRLMARMVEELLRTYDVRQRTVKQLANIILRPDVVDELFGIFPSENQFIHDVEELLKDFKAHMDVENKAVLQEDISTSGPPPEEEQPVKEVVSFIAIDVDNQSGLANKYGDQMIRNLCREVGLRLQAELESGFKKFKGYQFYHISADRFYVMLQEVPFEQLVARVKRLKKSLDGPYKISALYSATATFSPPPGSMQDVAITVRVAISSYADETIEDLLHRYKDEDAVAEVRLMIETTINEKLKKGMAKGGNLIIAWNPSTRRDEQIPLD